MLRPRPGRISGRADRRPVRVAAPRRSASSRGTCAAFRARRLASRWIHSAESLGSRLRMIPTPRSAIASSARRIAFGCRGPASRSSPSRAGTAKRRRPGCRRSVAQRRLRPREQAAKRGGDAAAVLEDVRDGQRELCLVPRSVFYSGNRTEQDDSSGLDTGHLRPEVGLRGQDWQSIAISSASQIRCIRSSLSRPRRSTSAPMDTLSTESRLTTEMRGIGSSVGSRSTSVGMPRIVVVQGPISVRRRRGIAASRESTTTGRRPTSGSSHHQTSPRAGRAVTRRRRRPGRTRGLPTRRSHRVGARRRQRTLHRSPLHVAEPATRRAPHR